MSDLSFLTPYWSGRDMMRIHLASLRQFHPEAPILVSRRGGDEDGEMRCHEREFGVRCWLEDCDYTDAHLRLLERCETRFACILDHDTVLLASLAPLLEGLARGRYDLVGVEERVRFPSGVDWKRAWPDADGWLRFAPGNTASNFLIFDWRAFKSRWGLRGVAGRAAPGMRHFELDYGIGQKLPRHRYLLPYHAPRYGIGNLLKDGDSPIVWHQWYGAYRGRLAEGDAVHKLVATGEQAFIEDYPALQLDAAVPAWGPERDVRSEQLSAVPPRTTVRERLTRWRGYGVRGVASRALARLDRWRRLR